MSHLSLTERATPGYRPNEPGTKPKETMWREDYLDAEREAVVLAPGHDGLPDLQLTRQNDWWVLTTPGGGFVNPRSRNLFKVEVYVFQVRGTAYRGAASRIADTRAGRPVLLRRERDNPVDPNAVQVQAIKARQHESPLTTGYVNKQNAARMAGRIDSGEAFVAIFIRGAKPGTEGVPWVLACPAALMQKLGRPDAAGS